MQSDIEAMQIQLREATAAALEAAGGSAEAAKKEPSILPPIARELPPEVLASGGEMAAVAQALEKGAGAALVSHIPEGVAADAPLLIVDDVLPALEKLGLAARARTKAKGADLKKGKAHVWACWPVRYTRARLFFCGLMSLRL